MSGFRCAFFFLFIFFIAVSCGVEGPAFARNGGAFHLIEGHPGIIKYIHILKLTPYIGNNHSTLESSNDLWRSIMRNWQFYPNNRYATWSKYSFRYMSYCWPLQRFEIPTRQISFDTRAHNQAVGRCLSKV